MGLFYGPSKGPSADNQGLATLTIVDHTDLHPAGLTGSCFVPREDVSNLIWVVRLSKGDINHCPGYLRIKSTPRGLVNSECGPFNFTECLEVGLP